jgi:hypothetical protein
MMNGEDVMIIPTWKLQKRAANLLFSNLPRTIIDPPKPLVKLDRNCEVAHALGLPGGTAHQI